VVGRAGVNKEVHNINADIIDKALAEACERLGFCTRLDARSLVKKYNGKMRASDFAASVIFAEGSHNKYSVHVVGLENIFCKHVKQYRMDYRHNGSNDCKN
jgi:hypothetical protein